MNSRLVDTVANLQIGGFPLQVIAFGISSVRMGDSERLQQCLHLRVANPMCHMQFCTQLTVMKNLNFLDVFNGFSCFALEETFVLLSKSNEKVGSYRYTRLYIERATCFLRLRGFLF